METAFFICLCIVVYTYLGYAGLLYALTMVFRPRRKQEAHGEITIPGLTVIVAAYNEEACIEEKILNCLSLSYPEEKRHFIFVTDGSADATPAIVSRYPQIQLLHQPRRHGKTAAVNRAMQHVQSELVVLTDANTMLNSDALLLLARRFTSERTGAVAGEKRVTGRDDSGAVLMEGWYWKLESALKGWEAKLYSVMGAAGELFCMRSDLYRELPADTILDDLLISVHVLTKGYMIQYEPAAVATETASATIADEWLRKTRIAAGGMQMLVRSGILFSSGNLILWFEFISHRVLRWLVAPWLLPVLLVLNIAWVYNDTTGNGLTLFLLCVQSAFYAIALAGWILQKKVLRAGVFYAPFYFCMMNAAMMSGTIRFIFQKQTVFWEKASRDNMQVQREKN